MKKTEHQYTEIIYECEICGGTSTSKDSVELCELNHNCEHKDFRFHFSYDGNYDGDREVESISKRCSACNFDLGERYFKRNARGHYEDEKMEKIYNILSSNSH